MQTFYENIKFASGGQNVDVDTFPSCDGSGK